jgi:quinol monooxygenase YgiN
MTPSPQQGDQRIVLVAVFQARPETRDELADRLSQLVIPSRAEPGCLRYDLHADEHDPCTFVFLETWANEVALATHDATEAVRAIRADAPRLTKAPLVVYRLRPVEPLGSSER